jgi:dTMP kinase
MSTRRGLFITLEGGEGAGKSTVLAAMRGALEAAGIAYVATREPGGTPLGEALRALVLDPRHASTSPEAELLMMFASRAQLVREVVTPALSAGQWVVSDRFTDASFAYQGGGRGLPVQVIAELERWSIEGLQPDRTFLLDVPVAVGLDRIAGRSGGRDRMEAQSEDFFERVRGAYRARAAAEPARFEVIDATQPAASVAAQVSASLARLAAAWREGVA